MNTFYIVWILSGAVGAYILNRTPNKVLFGRTLKGAMLRSAVGVIVLTSVVAGPFLLLLALLLPPKKLCPSCYEAIHQNRTICPHCKADIPIEISEVKKTPREYLLENQVSHFSPEVQAAVAKGTKDTMLPGSMIMIGTWIITLFLGVFVLNENPMFIGIGFLLGFIMGWLWWSYSVPRWRQWALEQPGVSPDELQKAAEAASLVWPKGHFFEKTEFKIKQTRRRN